MHDLTLLEPHPELLTELGWEWAPDWDNNCRAWFKYQAEGPKCRLSEATDTHRREAGFLLVEKLGVKGVWLEPQGDEWVTYRRNGNDTACLVMSIDTDPHAALVAAWAAVKEEANEH